MLYIIHNSALFTVITHTGKCQTPPFHQQTSVPDDCLKDNMEIRQRKEYQHTLHN